MNPFRDPLDLRLRPSRLERLFVLFAHAAASAAVGLAAMRLAPPWLILPVVGLSLARWLRRWGAHPHRIVRLQWRPDGRWRWQRADGEAATGRLAASSVSTPAIVLLHLRPVETRRLQVVAVWRDSVPAARFRHLRVRLRLHANQSGRD